MENSITHTPTGATDKDLPGFFAIKSLNHGLLLTSDQQTEHTSAALDRKQYLAEQEGGTATCNHATYKNTEPHLHSWNKTAERVIGTGCNDRRK